ncbi:MAG: TIGR02281 family clan AA aspartic protease [Novosphingobium sp.]
MNFDLSWQSLASSLHALPQSGLMIGTALAVLAGIAGSLLIRAFPALGRLLRAGSTLILAAILVLIVVQLSRFDSRFGLALPEAGLPRQEVSGDETRIPMARDGHFWIDAQVNGTPVRFMVDTGATLTAVSQSTAKAAGLEPRSGGLPVRLTTANGTVSAELTSIGEIRFGNVRAEGLDAVIAPNLGPMNVIGMNFLSRLQGWRVEGRTLILVPGTRAAEN